MAQAEKLQVFEPKHLIPIVFRRAPLFTRVWRLKRLNIMFLGLVGTAKSSCLNASMTAMENEMNIAAPFGSEHGSHCTKCLQRYSSSLCGRLIVSFRLGMKRSYLLAKQTRSFMSLVLTPGD